MDKGIVAHIEGTKGKAFAIYAEVFGSVVASDGATVQEAQAMFEEALEATALSYEDTGDTAMAKAIRETAIEYVYDVSSLFSLFRDINVSQFARRTGVSAEQLRQWRFGQKASEARLREVEAAIHQLGSELMAVRLT